MEAHPGAMEGHPFDMNDLPGAMRTHPGDVAAQLGAIQAHTVDTEDHPGVGNSDFAKISWKCYVLHIYGFSKDFLEYVMKSIFP